MKFFIMGDSWGVGEWCRQDGAFISVPDTGLDYHLRQLGHTVTNISAGSAGNFGQLRHGYWTLKENSDYDYIIWFHTESMRDIEEIIINEPEEGQLYFPDFSMSADFNPGLHYLNQKNYQYAQNMSNEYNLPFIVIGGQTPVDPVIHDFTFAQHIITSWLQELLELDFVPPANTFFSWDKIKRILDHYDIKERDFILKNKQEFDQAKVIQDLATKSKFFPDNGHPGRQCFEQLAYRLLEMINNDKRSTTSK